MGFTRLPENWPVYHAKWFSPPSAATLRLLRDAARNVRLHGNSIAQPFGEFDERGGQILAALGNLLNNESSVLRQELHPADAFDTLLDGNHPFTTQDSVENNSSQMSLQKILMLHKFLSDDAINDPFLITTGHL